LRWCKHLKELNQLGSDELFLCKKFLPKALIIRMTNTVPTIAAILKAQGIPDNVQPDQRIIDLAQHALTIYKNLAKPKGITKEISTEQFETLYLGNGKNETETPLENSYKLSNKLALFAVSIGENVCNEISRLFGQKDFALASMLDSTASEGVEKAAIFIEQTLADSLSIKNSSSFEVATRFSPGYCGWHISGQRKLFDYLNPEKIGIELKESYLMEPIKSISGVLVAGKKEIFDFSDDYIFCADCTDHSCRNRDFSYPGSK